jgi:IS30 family transposase
MKYKQLTYEQRYQIYACSKAGWLLETIAKEVGVHRSTIYREKMRNSGLRGYRPKQAHQMAVERKKEAEKQIKLTPYLKFEIAKKLREDWSPEQISGYFDRHNIKVVSHQTIYKYIYEDYLKGGTLYQHLRHAKKKKKKRYGSRDTRGQIKNKIMIDQRPNIVEKRSRIGDWEGDTMIGKNQKGTIVTLVERKSKFMLACSVSNKSEQKVSEAMVDLLWKYKDKVHTITTDNGKEFAGHEKVSRKLKAKFYFAHPYSSWERGLNENSNGLLRQYYPKKTDLRNITQGHIYPVLEKINNRPRKSLGYATPAEVFFGLIDGNMSQCQNVALAI